MTTESAFINILRGFAKDPAARGLLDDAAVVELGDSCLIITHDMMAEDVHFRSNADPADVAWKLVASNLSDLAAKGASPIGVLLGFMLGDDDWDRAFAAGLEKVLGHYGVALLGGDTVSNRGDKRAFGLTALGIATNRPVPSRAGAQLGDILYVTGTLGDALAGFELIDAGFDEVGALADAFNRPQARLSEGQTLAPFVHAMMDISDGLLIDAERMATASRLGIEIDLACIPLSPAYVSYRTDSLESRMQAASWGDDYELLFCVPADARIAVEATAVGRVIAGGGLTLCNGDAPVKLPPTLGYQHH
ncbi:MAG: thiamine-phosphate kinase [Sphingomonadaceae bacterium]|jgi:thiamine-monophosphate kinase|uniref:thiamine-phosphate kinase n=1 Tax=Sphingorhabdus sp. TaxID=1902408 RepID=UPI0039BC4DCA|nr:thiamine-phosphate kinase [Sphingomonadaceae bacterium]